jgi:hypothetical protein
MSRSSEARAPVQMFCCHCEERSDVAISHTWAFCHFRGDCFPTGRGRLLRSGWQLLDYFYLLVSGSAWLEAP